MLKTLAFVALVASCSALTAFGQNLVPNGDFSDGLNGWTVDEGTVTPVTLSGTNAAQFSDVGQSAMYSSVLDTVAGQQYTMTYTVSNDDDGYYFFSLVQNFGAPDQLYHNYYWNGVPSDTADAPITGTHIYSFIYTALSNDVVYISYSGNSVGNVSAVSSTVPEPSTWALLGLGTVLIAYRFVRRAKAA